MAAASPKTVRVHYRLASLKGGSATADTLQKKLQKVMAGKLGKDARERVFPISDDAQHKGCLNYSEVFSGAFVADIMHLDGRSVLPTWLHPKTPKPVADVIPKEISADEASLSEPAYILVRGNHVAAIERLGFRNSSMQRYLNALLQAAGELDAGTEWGLAPRIELTGTSGLSGGIKKIIFKPRAAVVGEAPTEVPVKLRSKASTISRRMGDLFAQGRRVIDMAIAAGADETKLEELRKNMSNDLALRARLEISVASVRRRTEAELQAGMIEQAFAELASEGDVSLVSPDGKSDGKLIQLVHTAEVLETGGLIDWQRATYALASALNAWAAKGSIDIAEE